MKRNPGAPVVIGDFMSLDLSDFHPFDCVLAQAFIHLFPLAQVAPLMSRLMQLLKPTGILTVSTTVSHESSEGWGIKSDYDITLPRFRRHWTKNDFATNLLKYAPRLLDEWHAIDPYGKEWIVLTAAL